MTTIRWRHPEACAPYLHPRMRRALLLLTLALYGFIAMDMHEWVRVPQVVLHLLEHHSDLGHHHDNATEHGHEDTDDHNPFGHEQHEACATASLVSLAAEPQVLSLFVPASVSALGSSEMVTALSDFSGSKWNPPKQA